jgi:hypothetical protein
MCPLSSIIADLLLIMPIFCIFFSKLGIAILKNEKHETFLVFSNIILETVKFRMFHVTLEIE